MSTIDALGARRVGDALGDALRALPAPHLSDRPVLDVPVRRGPRVGQMLGHARLCAGVAVLRLTLRWRRADGRGWRPGATCDVPFADVHDLLVGLGVAIAELGVVAALHAPEDRP